MKFKERFQKRRIKRMRNRFYQTKVNRRLMLANRKCWIDEGVQ